MNTSPPASGVTGDIWIDSNTGDYYVRVEDADTTQWVELSSIGLTGPTGPIGPSSLSLSIDANPESISEGVKAYRMLGYNGYITDWYIMSTSSGSISFDIKKASFADYPNSVVSIVSGTYPNLNNQIKNSGITTNWTSLGSTDILEFSVISNSGIKNMQLYMKTRSTT